jgi:hypothetical protein
MTEGSQGLSGTAARLGIPVGVGHGGLGDRVASEARHPAQVAVADTGPGARGQGPCEQARVAGAWEARAAPTDQEGVLPNGRGVLGGADADGDGAQRRRPQRGRQGGAARARRRPNGRNEGARPPRCPGRAGRSHATAASAAVGALAPAIRVQQDAGRLPPAPAAVRSFLARRARAQVHVSREMLRMRPYVQDRGTGSVIHLMRGGLEERHHPTTRPPDGPARPFSAGLGLGMQLPAQPRGCTASRESRRAARCRSPSVHGLTGGGHLRGVSRRVRVQHRCSPPLQRRRAAHLRTKGLGGGGVGGWKVSCAAGMRPRPATRETVMRRRTSPTQCPRLVPPSGGALRATPPVHGAALRAVLSANPKPGWPGPGILPGPTTLRK